MTAIALSHAVARTPLGWLDGLVDDAPVEVAAETGQGGDDLRLLFADGTVAEAQAKRTLKVGSELWETLAELAKAVMASEKVIGLLLIGPGSSRTIAQGLADDLVKLGHGEATGLSALGASWLTRLSDMGLNPAGVCGRLRIATVSALAAEAADVRTARSDLGHVCADPAEASRAWDRLYRDAHMMIEGRGRRSMEAVAQVLRSAGIALRSDAAGLPAAVLERICRWTAEVNSSFSILGVRTPLPIDKAWLPLIPRIHEAGDTDGGLAGAVARYHALDERPDQRDDKACAPDALGRFIRHCVVVAGPGMGKSTLMIRLARRYAEDGFPVLKVNARHLARRMATTGSSFLEAIFALGLGECDVAPAAARSARLRNWVLLLDGLDEAASEQANVISGLIGFAKGFPEARVVVTTRPVGYRRHALATWRHYELTLEGGERASNQMTRLLKHILPQDDARCPHLQRLTEEALERSEAAKAASRSPLMLALSAALFAHGDDLGRTRLAFYRAIFGLLEAEPPPRAGAPPAGLPVLRRVLDALGWILTENPLALKEKVLADCACALRPEICGAPLAVEELVGRCVDYWESLGVVEQLHHGPQNVVTFVHKTFGEFAAGRWIAGLPPDAQAEILRTRADLDGWREPVAFAAALGTGELVLQQLTRRGYSGPDGQARLIQALEILAEADPPLRGEAADAAYIAALARLDEDHRTWAFATGLALTALGPRLPAAVLNDVLTRLDHPQVWTRACAWCVSLAADPNCFHVEDLCKAVADFAGEAGATNRRSLGGAYVVGAADRAIVEAFCVGVAEVVLARHEPTAADEIIHANLRQKGLQTIGFAIRMERLLAANGLKYRWRDLANVGRRAMDFALPAEAERWQREGFSGIVAGLCAGVPPRTLNGEGAHYLYVLAALFELIGFRQSGVSEIYHFRSQKVAAVAPDVWRALARLAELPLDRLALEARAFLDGLEAGEADSLSLVFDRLPAVDLPEPCWDAARGIVDLGTVSQALSLPSEILAKAALKLVLAAATPEEIRDLNDQLLEDGRGCSIWAACNLVQRLPRDAALERLCQRVETVGGDRDIYSALAGFGLTEEPRHLNVLRIGLMGKEPYVAIEAAKALSQVAPAAALDLAREAYEHWLRHEEPYPEADGVVPPSPRDVLLPVILEGSDAPIDEVVAYVADRRVATIAQRHFIARLQCRADAREAIALQISAGRLPVAMVRAALSNVEGWSPEAVASMVTLLDKPEGALRLAALPLLRSPHLEEGERLRHLAILRHDAEPEIREAVIAMIPQLGVGNLDCFA